VKRVVWRTMAILVGAVMVWALVTLPPARTTITTTVPDGITFGAYHIHTNRSDGSGSIDDVARAAAEAGLQFVILADHGTAATPPEPPSYRHGVLVIDAVEVSTRDGHVVALGLRDASPYPLGGEGRDVIEDVHRMGGWTVAAHPDSQKADLRWRGPATDGIEWMNADSEWRDDGTQRKIQAALHYVIRPASAITSLFSRPRATLRRWDQWAQQRQVVGLAAVDAHARIGIDEQSEPRVARTILARPSYLDMFRTLVQAVWLSRPLTGEAAADADHILSALRAARTYSVVSAIAAPAVLTVTTTPTTMRAEVAGAPAAVVSIWRAGREVDSAPGALEVALGAPGLYRVEVRWPGFDVPWIVSAPVFVPAPSDTPTPAPPVAPSGRLLSLPPDGAWVAEHHQATTATRTGNEQGNSLAFTFADTVIGQFAALVHPLDPVDAFEEVRFTVRADRPRRFSVQVRLPGPGEGERWVRSVYADTTPREVRVRLDTFEPADRQTSRRPIAARLQSLLFVVDEPHTVPGSSGQIEISAVSLQAPPTSGR
jgi:hypothetical protein